MLFCSSAKSKSFTLPSQPLSNRRRSLRSRGGKSVSPEEPVVAPPQAEDDSASRHTESKVSTAGRRALRGSKPLASSHALSDAAAAITPRRYTRSTAKNMPSDSAHDNAVDQSAGSTPTQDESSSMTVDVALSSFPISLVVLSDICVSKNKLPSPPMDKVTSTDAPTISKPSSPVDRKSNDDNGTSPDPPASQEELLTESYEPELHFDEMSRDVAGEAGAAARSEAATPTLDEPASPDRITESPTSPPCSPAESYDPSASCSMVTIPLEGEESCILLAEPQDMPQDIPLPPTIPLNPTGKL